MNKLERELIGLYNKGHYDGMLKSAEIGADSFPHHKKNKYKKHSLNCGGCFVAKAILKIAGINYKKYIRDRRWIIFY